MNTRKVISRKLLFLTLITLTISCTIIQDSDMKGPGEFSKLKVKSFQIVQNLNEGTFTTDLQITLGGNGKLATINWPDLGSHKFRFRTPISGAAVSILTYNASGHLTIFDTQVNSVSMERYTFDYDASGNLVQVVSEGNFGTATDVLTYTAGVLSNIKRTTNISGPVTVINSIVTVDNYGALSLIESRNASGNLIDGYHLQSTCGYTQDTTLGASYNAAIATGVNSLCLRNKVSFDLPQSVSFTDGAISRNQQNGSSRDPDKYFFHPFMITQGYFKNDEALLAAYFRDSWKVGQTSNFNFKNDETVTINKVYGI